MSPSSYIVVVEDVDSVYDGDVAEIKSAIERALFGLSVETAGVFEVNAQTVSSLLAGVGRKVAPTGSPIPHPIVQHQFNFAEVPGERVVRIWCDCGGWGTVDEPREVKGINAKRIFIPHEDDCRPHVELVL